MPIRKKPCDVSHSFSGLLFEPDFDGTNIQDFEKIPAKQCPAKGYCFLSLRQFFPETWAGLEPAFHAIADDTRIVLVSPQLQAQDAYSSQSLHQQALKRFRRSATADTVPRLTAAFSVTKRMEEIS